MGRIVYVADTSMWINYVKFYPATVFPSLVQRCEAMIKDQRLLSPLPVLDEICRGSDEVVVWADKHKRVFVPKDDAIVARVAEITHKYPYLTGSSDGHNRADPYLIALALSIKNGVDNDSLPVIVTEENRESDIKIPKTADKCGVESCSTVGMFEREGWAF